jgi:hypothetical protein
MPQSKPQPLEEMFAEGMVEAVEESRRYVMNGDELSFRDSTPKTPHG